MENGVDWRIGEKFSGLTSPDLVPSTGTDDSDLLQVMKAVEAAEVTIKQQVEENIRLRSELEYKTLELHRRKQLLESSSPMPPRSSCLDPVGSHDELLRAPNSETSSQPEGEYDHLPRVDDSGEEGLMQLNHSGENKSAIEGLQISGEALPGHELQASGYSINGTTSCNFEWVRHLPDGSVNYIEGAKQPNYLLTADDVNTYLAIEVQPLDDRKRKGELVKVFANDHKKITCDPEMQSQIQKILQKGHGSFNVFEFTGFLDIWEPATLAIKRGSYSIKRSSEPSVVAAEKFSPNTFVSIPYGSPSEFMITDSDISGVNADHLLKTDDSSSSRDTLVLILRLFILRAVERRTRKGKKRVLFF